MTENVDHALVAGPLTGKVALVAGATRGAGRGTAVSLGEAGATVYCTGRTTRERSSEYDRPETIEETADLVTAAGGKGIAVEVDHLEPTQVEALVQRIDAESGRLDVLVNDIWGGELLFEWETPVWEHDLENGLRILRLAIDTHLITSHFALPLLIREPGGLVVEMTDGTRGVQRGALPSLGLLRPGQDGGDQARVRAERGARAARLYRSGADARLAALGDDARALRRYRRELARRGRPSIRTSPRSLRARGSSAVRSPP
jgi:NAD(P)-dependent dehydrogenase (short-subunit alcohol dehydrogenase family)